jgi:hypothetical protein
LLSRGDGAPSFATIERRRRLAESTGNLSEFGLLFDPALPPRGSAAPVLKVIEAADGSMLVTGHTGTRPFESKNPAHVAAAFGALLLCSHDLAQKLRGHPGFTAAWPDFAEPSELPAPSAAHRLAIAAPDAHVRNL